MDSYSFSRVGTFQQCQRKFKYSYIDQLTTLPSDDPQNALFLGLALHEGIETDADRAIKRYFDNYPVITDIHINEEIKLRYYLSRVWDYVPRDGIHELAIEDEGYVGFVDYITFNEDGSIDIWDWKYANEKNAWRYKASAQLHLYKYFLERQGYKVRGLHYLLFPKTQIRQKKTEDLIAFRSRLKSVLADKKIQVIDVPLDEGPKKLEEFFQERDKMFAAVSAKNHRYQKNESRLCDWCDFQDYCEKGDTYMLLPKNERRIIDSTSHKKIWIYGAPFTGKTTLADQFPDPLMINTDGNIKWVTAPYVAIKDTVTAQGRIKNRTFAWENFKAYVEELEAMNHGYKTLVVDLLEDIYAAASEFVCHENGWQDESDGQYGKGYQLVQREFFTTLKKLTDLPMNIVLLSHENAQDNITKRSGATISTVKPNIRPKAANKIAGMVDVVARAVVIDDEHFLSFKTDESQFGGGRLKLEVEEVELTFEALEEVYKTSAPNVARKAPSKKAQEKPEEVAEAEESSDDAPKRRRRASA